MLIIDVSEVNPNHDDLKGIPVSLMRPSSIILPVNATSESHSNEHQKVIDETSIKLQGYCRLNGREFMTLNSDDDEEWPSNAFPQIIDVEDISENETNFVEKSGRGTSTSSKKLTPEHEFRESSSNSTHSHKPHRPWSSQYEKKRKFKEINSSDEENDENNNNIMADSPTSPTNNTFLMHDDEDGIYSPKHKRIKL
jgi:hypothetical protein